MIFILLVSAFLSVNSYAATSGEMCLHSHQLMDMHHQIYQTVADNMFLQSKIEGKPLVQTLVKLNDNNHCLTAEGDDKIVAKIKELYEENKKELPFPGTEIKKIQVQVHISGFAEPFLSLPESNSNVLYDMEKNPVTVTARLLHPKIIELTYDATFGKYTKNFHMNELVACLHPRRDKRGTRDTFVQDNGIVHQTNFANPGNFQPHYLKKENNFIEISTLRFRATLR